MTQTIWVARHGNREDFVNRNWSKTAARPYDPALSTSGESQGSDLGQRLRDEAIDGIFTSPFLRTIQTANYVAEVRDLPLKLEYGLSELFTNLNIMPEILSQAERTARFPRIDSSHESVLIPTYPEDVETNFTRSATAVRKVAEMYPDSNLLFVSHASCIVGIVRRLANITAPISVPLCGLFKLVQNGSGWQLEINSEVDFMTEKSESLRFAHTG